MTINVKKLETDDKNYRKYAEIRDVKILQDIPRGGSLFLRLKKSKKNKVSKKLEKSNFCQQIAKIRDV